MVLRSPGDLPERERASALRAREGETGKLAPRARQGDTTLAVLMLLFVMSCTVAVLVYLDGAGL